MEANWKTPIECASSSNCAPYKHHYDECVERVTKQEEDEDYKGPKEDCVEECKWHFVAVDREEFLMIGSRLAIPRYTDSLIPHMENDRYSTNADLSISTVFHLTHCATQCAAPKLFKALK